EWLMDTVRTMIFLEWEVTHGLKRLYAIPQKKTLYVLAILLLILSHFFKTDYNIQKLTDIVSQVGFWIIFVYPIVLLPLVLIKKQWQKRKGSRSEEHTSELQSRCD